MPLRKHAERELELAGYDDGDGMNALMKKCVLELIDVFAAQGHSGFSAPYCVALFKKLALFEPLLPLTGKDDEWNLISDRDHCYQNKRASSVFKENGQAYDIDGKIFEDPDGGRYTSKDSRVPVEFPYVPTSVIVKVDDEGTPLGEAAC
jgi:hypothetical protein